MKWDSITLIICIAFILLGAMFLGALIAEVCKMRRVHAELQLGFMPNQNDILSGKKIKNYNRQPLVYANRNVYGVRNAGVTMNKRQIYSLDYCEVIGDEGQ